MKVTSVSCVQFVQALMRVSVCFIAEPLTEPSPGIGNTPRVTAKVFPAEWQRQDETPAVPFWAHQDPDPNDDLLLDNPPLLSFSLLLFSLLFFSRARQSFIPLFHHVRHIRGPLNSVQSSSYTPTPVWSGTKRERPPHIDTLVTSSLHCSWISTTGRIAITSRTYSRTLFVVTNIDPLHIGPFSIIYQSLLGGRRVTSLKRRQLAFPGYIHYKQRVRCA